MDTESSVLYQKTCLDYCFEKPIKVPYITTALMDAKLGTEGRKDLFDWLSRQLSGLSNFPNAVNLNYVLFQIVMRDGCDL
ncbi:Protein MOR1 [Camellia lanceoleosa]|uniref:Protein MOR1 n=1 Tax=Camellia lanceoleosa TaxID=1840588 RepID=A0ACC0GAB6_9ERIC|nr:Protein MOR1 [Camellia lanceoleosa]